MKKLGIIGTGNIANFVFSKVKNKINKTYVYDIDTKKTTVFVQRFKQYKIIVCNSICEVVRLSDVILESASINAVKDLLNCIKKYKNKHLIILSVGGVLQNYKTYKTLVNKGYNIYIPSGAIAGTDALSATKYTKVYSISLKTIKPVVSLKDSPYFKLHKNLYNRMLKQNQTVVYKGDVYNAIKYFPQNINVAATLAVVANKPKKISVTIVADKNIRKNIHEITIRSSSGKIFTRTENIPSPENPKTSYLASLSVLPILEQILKQ